MNPTTAMNPRMHVQESILDTVGHTPMVRLSRLFPQAQVLAKLEIFNPNGSSKDRIAVNLLNQAEQHGLIHPGDTLVEPSSGNTGMGIAMAGVIKGYKVIITMPRKMSQEKALMLEALGAEVIWCPTEAPHGHPDNYVDVAERLAQENPNTHLLNQLVNPDNPQTHFETTGPEIWAQTEGKIDYFVCGIGTSGTIIGTGRYLKTQNPNIQIIGIDPVGSAYSGDELGNYLVEGIGYDFHPPIYDATVVDRFIRVTDVEAFPAALELARTEAILAGGSTGSVVAGMKKLLAETDLTGKTVVMMVHDTGRNYLTKFYDTHWMEQQGFKRP